MKNIIIGLVALVLGIWGLSTFRWYMVDILIGVFPIMLLILGVVALLAGIKITGMAENLPKSNRNPMSTGSATKRKDE